MWGIYSRYSADRGPAVLPGMREAILLVIKAVAPALLSAAMASHGRRGFWEYLDNA